MATFKSAASRALRTKFTPPKFTAPKQEIMAQVSRSIASTTRNSAFAERTSQPQTNTPFIPQDFHAYQNTPQPQSTPTSLRFSQLITSLTTSLRLNPNASIPELSTLLRSYTSNHPEWSQFSYASFQKQYTRNLVAEVPGLFNLLLLVWTPGKQSPVHDHADAHCLMKVLKGELRETRYRIPDVEERGRGELELTSSKVFGCDKVTYMADSLGLHSVGNPSPTEYAVSLHLYTPPNAAMRGCHVYDPSSSEAKHVLQGAYDSIRGVPTAPETSFRI